MSDEMPIAVLPPRGYSRLRMAITAASGTLCILVIGLWTRGFWWQDHVWLTISSSTHVSVLTGQRGMIIWFELRPLPEGFVLDSKPITFPRPKKADRIPWLDVDFWPNFLRVYTTHWILTVVTGLVAAIPWCPTRFTTRSLLISTTIVAAIVATIEWTEK